MAVTICSRSIIQAVMLHLDCDAAQVVYASRDDLEASQRLEKGIRRGAVQEMAGLLMEPGCRRKKVLKYFGEAR
jgi:hypothetical protein